MANLLGIAIEFGCAESVSGPPRSPSPSRHGLPIAFEKFDAEMPVIDRPAPTMPAANLREVVAYMCDGSHGYLARSLRSGLWRVLGVDAGRMRLCRRLAREPVQRVLGHFASPEGRRTLTTRSAASGRHSVAFRILFWSRSAVSVKCLALFPPTTGSNVSKGRQRDEQRLVVIDRGQVYSREVPTTAVRLDGAMRIKHAGRSLPIFRPNSSKTGSAAGVVNLFRE